MNDDERFNHSERELINFLDTRYANRREDKKRIDHLCEDIEEIKNKNEIFRDEFSKIYNSLASLIAFSKIFMLFAYPYRSAYLSMHF